MKKKIQYINIQHGSRKDSKETQKTNSLIKARRIVSRRD